MSMKNWAERECRIACKKENASFNFDDPNDWDYGCSCYKSALKAYNSLCEDEHSGASFGFTKNILIRLMEGRPLTPITDDDFFSDKESHTLYSDEYLKSMDLKSDIQCPRMSSLFRMESLDGKVTYHDNNRAYCVDAESPSDTYSSGVDKIVDRLFPITMPYMPQTGKYKIYVQTFLCDAKNGDYDTRGVLYMIAPDGERIDINEYQTDVGGEMVDITKDEYERLLAKRLDPVYKKVANHLIWTLVSNSGTDEEIEKKEKSYKRMTPEMRDKFKDNLEVLCKFFDNPDNYQYNVFSIHQALCKGNVDNDIPELVAIRDYLKFIKDELTKF